MRRARHSTEQMLAILKEADAGVPLAELSRIHDVHEETIRQWRKRFSGMQGSDVAKLKTMSEENARLKRIVAHLSLEVDALKDALEKNS
ncbi:hypothetical protein BH11ARM2_BH11ARM2_37580 [soil metagenome]